MIISIDSGSSYLKAFVEGKEPFLCETVIYEMPATKTLRTNSAIEIEGKQYLVGSEAWRSRNKFNASPEIGRDFHGGFTQYVQLCFAFEKLGVKGNHKQLLMSLPYSDCTDKEINERVKSRKEFKWNNKKVTFDEVIVYPQGSGAFTYYIKNHNDAPKKIAIVDIGSCTVDLVVVIRDKDGNYVYNIDSTQSFRKLAVCDFMTMFTTALKQQSGLQDREFDYFELSESIKDKDFLITHDSFDPIDATKIFNESRDRYTQEIYNMLQMETKNLWHSLDKVILCSGGAKLINMDKWKCAGRTMQLDEFANVMGQYYDAMINKDA